jgi:4-amino-4-deoxy-L-arabinose transferase-like glycosyltransferase
MSTTPLDPPAPALVPSAHGVLRLRAPWRSPGDQPGWARPGLLAIALVAAVLYAGNLGRSQYNGYFSMAVRSMTESWTNFLFGALDPGGTVTIDKIPGFLWPQALAARLLGFHPWVLTLPQVIEGVVSVLVLYRVVRCWAGPAAGLLAAAVFALTPITAVMFGHTLMEDPALTMCLVLAADAWQRAANTARLRPLLLAALWIGLGFQAKMLQAWLVLPAFAVVHLLVAPTTTRRRIAHVAAAGAVTLVVSASWVLVAVLVPSSDRPFIDGTTDNSAYTMVVGYNGVDRFGGHLAGTLGATGNSATGNGAANTTGSAPGSLSGAALPPGVQQLLAQTKPADRAGWGKLFGADLASQIGWLYPLAVLALVVGLVASRGRPRTDRLRGGYLMWGLWLAVTSLAFSAGSVAHASYTAALAAPLAALCGAGLVAFWRGYQRAAHPVWLLPAAIAAETGWTVYLLTKYPAFLPWLSAVILVLAATGIAALVVARGGSGAGRRLAAVGLLAGVAAMTTAPTAWSLSTLDSRYAGTILDAYAGPNASSRAGSFSETTGTLTAPQTRLLDYVRSHRGHAGYLFAADSWSTASPYVLASGAPVLPLGGFSGQAPTPTLARFKQLVATGQVRYTLLSDSGFSLLGLFGGDQASTEADAVTTWVKGACTKVDLGGQGAPTTTGGFPGSATGTLYDCGASH